MTLGPWNAKGLALLLAAGLVFFGGCGNEKSTTGPGPVAQENPNLTDPTGGLSSSDEQPAFGDQSLVTAAGEEESQQDVIAQDPTVTDIESGRLTSARIYAVTILWGMLQEPGSAGSIGAPDGNQYDWSGTLSVNRGAVVLRSVVSFEQPGDHMILPRPDRRTLEWASFTGEGFDGIRLLVYELPSPGAAENDSLFLDMPMYKQGFLLSDLAGMDSLVTVDQIGNGVRIESFLTEPASQARGFLRGFWGTIAAGDSLGSFKGVWISDRGGVSGYLRGHYGINSSGDRVFFGKYVNSSGAFEGFIKGTWGTNGPDPAMLAGSAGWFAGRWSDARLSEKGQLRGRWRSPTDRVGFFDGRWCMGCDLVRPEG
jgi:hypothetical protein